MYRLNTITYTTKCSQGSCEIIGYSNLYTGDTPEHLDKIIQLEVQNLDTLWYSKLTEMEFYKLLKSGKVVFTSKSDEGILACSICSYRAAVQYKNVEYVGVVSLSDAPDRINTAKSFNYFNDILLDGLTIPVYGTQSFYNSLFNTGDVLLMNDIYHSNLYVISADHLVEHKVKIDVNIIDLYFNFPEFFVFNGDTMYLRSVNSFNTCYKFRINGKFLLEVL